jgi:hypothetical protein
LHNINQRIQTLIRMLLGFSNHRYHIIDMLLLARDVLNLTGEILNLSGKFADSGICASSSICCLICAGWASNAA